MKKSNFPLHRVSAAVLTVLASAQLQAVEANPTGAVHGRQIEVQGEPGIQSPDAYHFSVKTLPTASDPDTTDTHTGWRYVWQVDQQNVGDEQDATDISAISPFLSRAEDGGKKVSLCVSALASSGYPDHTKISAPVCANAITAKPYGTAPQAEGLTVSGTLEPGETLTASYSYQDADGDLEGETQYQWYVATQTGIDLIPNGTQSTHTIRRSDVNTNSVDRTPSEYYLVVEVTPKSASGMPNIGKTVRFNTGPTRPKKWGSFSTPDRVIREHDEAKNYCANLTQDGQNNWRLPTSAELLAHSKTLPTFDARANTGWPMRGGELSSIYLATDGVVNIFNAFAYPIDLTRNGFVTCTSAPGNAPVISDVSILGTVAVGQLLTGDYQYSDAEGDADASTFQWYRADNSAGTLNRVAIAGATAKTYTVAAADRNKYLVFEVTAKSATGTPDTGNVLSRTTTTAVPGTAPAVSGLAIAGTAAVGNTLTGSYSYNDVDGDADASTFQWYRADNSAGTINRVAIAGATAKTYTVAAADRNKYLVFEVTAKSATGTPDTGNVLSRTTTTAVPGTAPTASSLSISGTVEIGNTLRGSYSYYDAEGDANASTFQWYRADDAAGTLNRVAISGATAHTYTVSGADANKYLVFEVTPRSSSGQPNVGSPRNVVTVPRVVSRVLSTFTLDYSMFSTHRMIWPAANTYCNSLVLHGKSDWRLPTTAELQNLYYAYGSLNNLFPSWPAEHYWTSNANGSEKYEVVNLHSNGFGYSWTNSSNHYVTCVSRR